VKSNKYFNISEFKCKCGKCEIPNGMPPDALIDLLIEIREHFNKPLIINSGYRCESHNKKIGGATHSRHVVGDAVDFTIKDFKTKDVFEYIIKKYNNEPLGLAISINPNNEYSGFIHLDTRGKKARWSYNKAGELYFSELKQKLNLA